MAQRICQQDRALSSNLVKSCKKLPRLLAESVDATRTGRFDSTLVQRFPLVKLPFSDSITLSIRCGKPREKLRRFEHSKGKTTSLSSFDTRLLTCAQRLPTRSEQLVVRQLPAQPPLRQGDLNRADDYHQKSISLLSSKTVIKYSSYTERGRTTTPRFKRTAP